MQGVMYKFHYSYALPRWAAEHASLLFTDTDSLTYHIKTKDAYRDMIPVVVKWFDTSKYSLDHQSGILAGQNLGVLGCFKDEFSGKRWVTFAD